MLKEIIKYTDYNDNNREFVAFFNLNKSEILKMEMSVKGGMTGFIQSIIDTKDPVALIKLWDDLIDLAYGVKTVDGNFVKRPEDLEAFKSSMAYNELYMKLATDADYAAEFIKGIFPKDLVEQAEKELKTLPAAE